MIIPLADYTIYLDRLSNTLSTFLSKNNYSQFFILVDENTRRYCLPLLENYSELSNAVIFETESGEIHKNLTSCQFLWRQLLKHQADRNALVINLGGGVIGDMGGFVAATYKRGIDFIQIPTTLLAQVDASVGGKLGIDFQDVKNAVGLFKNPKAVFIDPLFLQTLPTRQLLNGFAEVIKHALIADANYLDHLLQLNLPPIPYPQTISLSGHIDWMPLILRSILIKKKVVEADPYEKGWRKILNFGHSIGHAIESYALKQDGKLLHGEAIVIGMMCELYLSVQKTAFPHLMLKELERWFLSYFSPYHIPEKAMKELIPLLQNDKKNKGSDLKFTLLKTVGEPLFDQTISMEEALDAIAYYRINVSG